MRHLAIILLIVSVGGCRSMSHTRIRADSQDEMLTAVRAVVPVGMSIDDAKTQMENAGFECKDVKDSSFAEDPGFIGDDREYRSVKNANFLRCSRDESAGLLVSHIWTVAIVYDQTANVSDVLVLHQMEGP